jgi:hypothetical protein
LEILSFDEVNQMRLSSHKSVAAVA